MTLRSSWREGVPEELTNEELKLEQEQECIAEEEAGAKETQEKKRKSPQENSQ